jgi:hypothetical protein
MPSADPLVQASSTLILWVFDILKLNL